jgi:hypothetical protein
MFAVGGVCSKQRDRAAHQIFGAAGHCRRRLLAGKAQQLRHTFIQTIGLADD